MNNMTKKIGAAFASALIVSTSASMAGAQAAAPASTPLSGPAIVGLCALSEASVVHDSTVGKAVTARLAQLKSAAEAEIDGVGNPLQNDENAFVAARASLTADQINQRGSALQARQEQYDRLVQLRNAELSQTAQTEEGAVFNDAVPIISQVARQRNCSIVLSGQGVLMAEPSIDLTPSVIDGLNRTVTQIQFDRVHLDQNTGAPAR